MHPPVHEITKAIEKLEKEAVNHPAVHHPYLVDLAKGKFHDIKLALQDFACCYYYYSAAFPSYLTLTISKLENPNHRKALMHNLIEEHGFLNTEDRNNLELLEIDPTWVEGIPHPLLFRRFVESLDIENISQDFTEDSVGAICWRDNLLAFLKLATPAEAVGALGLGTEYIVKHIYPYVIQAINHYGKISRKDAIFFDLHCFVDDEHAKSLREIAIDFAKTKQGLHEIRLGMHKALSLRAAFWDWMYKIEKDHNYQHHQHHQRYKHY